MNYEQTQAKLIERGCSKNQAWSLTQILFRHEDTVSVTESEIDTLLAKTRESAIAVGERDRLARKVNLKEWAL